MSTKEEDNFLRTVYLNYRVATPALRRCFDRKHPNLAFDLSIPANKKILSNLCNTIGRRKILNAEQLKILYPLTGNYLANFKLE